MSDQPLIAHSWAEVYLYLMVTPCGNCGRGPLQGSDARAQERHWGMGLVVDVTCGACKDESQLAFQVPMDQLAAARELPADAVAMVNQADEPSSIIDVVGWVTLFGVIGEAATKTANKIEARKLGCEAAQCLEEALKFYDDDNDLPPDRAFFSDASRRHYRDYPDKLARTRLIDLRAKLPALDAMQRQLARVKKRRWWKPWT